MIEKMAKILTALMVTHDEQRRALDLLGKAMGLEWNRETGEWKSLGWNPIEKEERADG